MDLPLCFDLDHDHGDPLYSGGGFSVINFLDWFFNTMARVIDWTFAFQIYDGVSLGGFFIVCFMVSLAAICFVFIGGRHR